MFPSRLLAALLPLMLVSAAVQADDTVVFVDTPPAASAPANPEIMAPRVPLWLRAGPPNVNFSADKTYIVTDTQRPPQSPSDLTQLCLMQANQTGREPHAETPDTLSPEQWKRFARCAIGMDISFAPGSVRYTDDALATVQIDLAPDGKIDKISVDSDDNPNFIKAIQQAIDIMPALPPAPDARQYQTVTLHYQPRPWGAPVAPANAHGWRHCISVGLSRTCE